MADATSAILLNSTPCPRQSKKFFSASLTQSTSPPPRHPPILQLIAPFRLDPTAALPRLPRPRKPHPRPHVYSWAYKRASGERSVNRHVPPSDIIDSLPRLYTPCTSRWVASRQTVPQPRNIKPSHIMTDTMPFPQQHSAIPRNDSFSSEDLAKALKASASKPRNELSLRVVHQDAPTVPPPSPIFSRPSSVYGNRR